MTNPLTTFESISLTQSNFYIFHHSRSCSAQICRLGLLIRTYSKIWSNLIFSKLTGKIFNEEEKKNKSVLSVVSAGLMRKTVNSRGEKKEREACGVRCTETSTKRVKMLTIDVGIRSAENSRRERRRVRERKRILSDLSARHGYWLAAQWHVHIQRSRDTFILLIVMAQAVHATRPCIFMQVRAYLFILFDGSRTASDYS